MNNDPHNSEAEVIYSYSRAQALEDGELVDCSEWAGTNSGFRVPVAFTRALFETIRDIPEDCGQDIKGRVHDVLFLAHLAARKSSAPRCTFQVFLTQTSGNKINELVIDIGPGDEGEAVITIGFSEDF
jgi:hypothetical protein